MNITLTQRMTTAIGKFDLELAVRGIRSRNSAHRDFRTAMVQAYNLAARHYHPRWTTYLLDKEFQAACEPRLRASCLEGGACLTAVELAHFWAGQLEWVSEAARLKHTAELLGVADRFLRCLNEELREREVLAR